MIARDPNLNANGRIKNRGANTKKVESGQLTIRGSPLSSGVV